MKIMPVQLHHLATYDHLCKVPAGTAARGEVIFDRESVFDNGYRMAIQVVVPYDTDDEPCWSQGVLFDKDGNELGCTDVGDQLSGDYVVWHGDDRYAVSVIEG
jgi:hypothetical protein